MDAFSDSKRERVNELFNTTLHKRLDNQQSGVITVVMQRLHADDLSCILRRSSDKRTTLSFPAIAEREQTIQIGKYDRHERHIGDVLHLERDSREDLEATRSQIGAQIFWLSTKSCIAGEHDQTGIDPSLRTTPDPHRHRVSCKAGTRHRKRESQTIIPHVQPCSFISIRSMSWTCCASVSVTRC